MASNLSLFPFTNLADTAISENGWYVETGIVVNTHAGRDRITGTDLWLSDPTRRTYYGIFNEGIINTGAYSDTIIGNGFANLQWLDDYGIYNIGTIITGTGNDTIEGNGGDYGIYNQGRIGTGTGNDTITGHGNPYGISNAGGTINTGDGNDTITGSVGNSGISAAILNSGTINTRKGDDTISGINTWSIYTQGIFNRGTINTGAGNDTITGSGGDGRGIYNDGTIETGTGNDTVDALSFQLVREDGFGGTGNIYLGGGKDTLKGFGAGTFNGGASIDKILFGQGTYTVTGSTIISGGVTMNVNEFEKIGGVNGRLLNFRDGTLTVNSDGVATFAA